MPIPLVNSVASWFLKKRFHQIELFLKYPNEVQNELLLHLIETAKDTQIGNQYDFASITNYETFVDRVPISCYEDYQNLIERSRQGEHNIFWPTPIKWFAKSSGTTNAKSKFIPVSQESLEDCHYAASKDLLCMYLNNNESSQLFNGKSLRLGGSKKLYKEKGTVFLKRMKEVWNWIPSIERTIKLPPSMMSQSWMGTDFTNDDLVKEASSVSDYTHTLLNKETISGKECYKIEMIPLPSAAIVWEKVIVWIDALEFLQLKAEFYDEDSELVNVMNSEGIKEMGGRKITSKIEMIPIDKEGNSTWIIYNSIRFDEEIDDNFFNTRKMKQLE